MSQRRSHRYGRWGSLSLAKCIKCFNLWKSKMTHKIFPLWYLNCWCLNETLLSKSRKKFDKCKCSIARWKFRWKVAFFFLERVEGVQTSTLHNHFPTKPWGKHHFKPSGKQTFVDTGPSPPMGFYSLKRSENRWRLLTRFAKTSRLDLWKDHFGSSFEKHRC